ncbi:hypothetical protein [Paraflavitalea speifideaquila]|nr:hypothetical protein [Paraflavitalea speifideiaquila]
MELLTYIIAAFVLMTGKAAAADPGPRKPLRKVFSGSTPCRSFRNTY